MKIILVFMIAILSLSLIEAKPPAQAKFQGRLMTLPGTPDGLSVIVDDLIATILLIISNIGGAVGK